MMRKRCGFTLIEMVIVTTIISVLAGITIHLMAQGFESWFLMTDRRMLLQQSRTSMNHLFENIAGDFVTGGHTSAADDFDAVNSPDVGSYEFIFDPISGDNDGCYPFEQPPASTITVNYEFFPRITPNPAKSIMFGRRDPGAGESYTSSPLNTTLVGGVMGVGYFSLRYFRDDWLLGDFTEITIPTGAGASPWFMSPAETQEIGTIELNIRNSVAFEEGNQFQTRSLVYPRNEGRPEPCQPP